MSVENYNLTTFQYGLTGLASGVFTRFTCQPFDVLKIRFQVQMTPFYNASSNLKYKSLLQAASTIAREEGLKSFWKGHVPAQWLSAIYGAAQFASYEKLTKPWKKNTAAHFAGGAVSGLIAVTVSYPFDVLRTRLVAQKEPKIYQNMLDSGKQIFVTEGWRGFFKGLSPACMQTAPLTALVFGINHILIGCLGNIPDNSAISITMDNLFCGAVAGFSAKLLVYPFDLVKKRLQLQGMPEGASASGPIVRMTGLLNCLAITLRNEGIVGLYKGLTPSLLKATVSYAVYLTSYNEACRFISYSSDN